MAPDLTPPPPGSMTVPPLFGWEGIATVLVLLVAVGVAFLVVATTRSGTTDRAEWQAWLAARSGGRDGRAAPSTPGMQLHRPGRGRGGAAAPAAPDDLGVATPAD